MSVRQDHNRFINRKVDEAQAEPPAMVTSGLPLKPIWNEQFDAFLRENGPWKTATELTRALNAAHGTEFTRSAVLGRSFRIGVRIGSAVPRAPQPEPARKAAPSSKGNNYSSEGAKAAGALARIKQAKSGEVPSYDFKPRTVDAQSRHVPLLNLGPFGFECRWPDDELNDAGQQTFCGAPTAHGASYCCAHMAIAWGIGTASERSALKTLLEASR